MHHSEQVDKALRGPVALEPIWAWDGWVAY